MGKKVLPLDNKPPYMTFHEQAFPLGIISANGIDTREWLCGNTLVLCSPNSELIQAQCTDKLSFLNEGPLICEKIWLYPNDVLNHESLVVKRIINLIESGFYISGYANFRCIPMNKAYNNYDRVFNIQIYGFDTEQELLYCIGYIDNWVYKPYRISFTQFLDSQKAREDERFEFTKIKFNEQYSFSFDKRKTISFLNAFLESKYAYSYLPDFEGYKYGIEAQNVYLDYLNTVMNQHGVIDVRNSRSLFEFKKMVLYYFQIQKDDPKCLGEEKWFQMIYKPYEEQHFLCMKYNLTRDAKLISDTLVLLMEAFKKEELILKEYIESIS